MTTARVIMAGAGGVLAMMGAVALRNGVDSALRIFPAMFLPLSGSLVGGSELPPFLTNAGVVVVYIVPGLLLFAIATFPRRRKTPAQQD